MPTKLELNIKARHGDALSAGADGIYDVIIQDPVWPGLEAQFEYRLVQEVVVLCRVQVLSLSPGNVGIPEITATELRTRARWGAWEAAARTLVEEFAVDMDEEPDPSTGDGSFLKAAQGAVRVNWEERLSRLALEYRSLVKEGVRNPVEVIAKNSDTPTETIRAWIHRARQEGYLPRWKSPPRDESKP